MPGRSANGRKYFYKIFRRPIKIGDGTASTTRHCARRDRIGHHLNNFSAGRSPATISANNSNTFDLKHRACGLHQMRTRQASLLPAKVEPPFRSAL
jgi:hypothetical protein